MRHRHGAEPRPAGAGHSLVGRSPLTGRHYLPGLPDFYFSITQLIISPKKLNTLRPNGFH